MLAEKRLSYGAEFSRFPPSVVRDASAKRAALRRLPNSSEVQELVDCMAEREGFEPSIRGYRIHTFQACAFDHSATAPLA